MNGMKRTGVIFIAVVFSLAAAAQTKTTTTVQQVWLGYFNQTRIANKFGFWFDGQLRTKEDFLNGLSVSIIRPGVTYYVNDALKLTAGYAYVTQYPQDNLKESRPENRIWQQVQWHTKYAKNRTMQWIRLEERFRRKIAPDSTLAEGNNFNYRIRYNFLWQVPLSGSVKKGALSLVLNDEVHVAFGKEVVYSYFDQNRFFAGLAYNLNATDNIQFGYLNVFQQLPAGNQYRSIHGARIFYFHNLDLRGKKANL
jgi:long-subunit fatty acid transport protein